MDINASREFVSNKLCFRRDGHEPALRDHQAVREVQRNCIQAARDEPVAPSQKENGGHDANDIQPEPHHAQPLRLRDFLEVGDTSGSRRIKHDDAEARYHRQIA